MTFYSIPPFLTLCCFMGLAALAIFLRPPEPKPNLLFFYDLRLRILSYISTYFLHSMSRSAKTSLWVSRTAHFFIVYLIPPCTFIFFTPISIFRGEKWLIRGAYAYAFFLMCLTPTPFFIESMQKHYFGYFPTGRKPLFFFRTGRVFCYPVCPDTASETPSAKRPDSSHKNRLKYLICRIWYYGPNERD